MKRVVLIIALLCLIGGFVFAEGQQESAKSNLDLVSLVNLDGRVTISDLEAKYGEPTVPAGAKFAYVTRTLYNEFWRFEADGFEAGCEQFLIPHSNYAVTDEGSITEQLDKAKAAARQGFTAMFGSPISATALDSVFEEQIAAGVPCIILNDARGTLPGVVYVGPDALQIGATAADYIATKLPAGGHVAMIEGDPGSSNAVNRGIGFKEQLKAHPNLKLVNSQTAMWDANKARTIATAMLTADPTIKAFYCQNDVMAFGVAAALEEKGLTDSVILVGTDGIPQAKKEIMAGRMTATVSEAPVSEGIAGVKAALWLLEGKELPGWVEVPAFIIDESNVDQYPTGMP